jgi:hypothetical protein
MIMPAEITRRKTWRSEYVPSWTIAGLSATDTAYWMYHIREQAKTLSLQVSVHAEANLSNSVLPAIQVLVVGSNNATFEEASRAMRIIRETNSELPIVVWLPKYAALCGSAFLESGASLIITRREQIPTVAGRLLKFTKLAGITKNSG